jgi:methionyl-tRNA formyltransferase
MARSIALFGQAAFGRDVLTRLVEAGHPIVAVYAPPDSGRPDPLAEEASSRGLRLLRHRRFRRRGEAIPELVAEHRSLAAELNVLAYVTAILPAEIVEGPPFGSLCFHPSLLPRFRGGAAIAWQIILGERETGVTVFRPDAGVDTGPIVVQRGGVRIEDSDTAGSLYYRKLYPLGVEAMLEAVQAVDGGEARLVPQDESRATFQGLVDDDVARIDWERPAPELDRLIRGCDPQPGAHALWKGESLRLYDERLIPSGPQQPPGTVLSVEKEGLRIAASDGVLQVGRVRVGSSGKIPVGEAGFRPGDRLS